MSTPEISKSAKLGLRFSKLSIVIFTALLSAIVVYFAVPTSRILFTEPWWGSHWDKRVTAVRRLVNGIDLIRTADEHSHALAIRIAANEVFASPSPNSEFAKLGASLALKGEKEQPDNAFWPESAAAFLTELRDYNGALKQWDIASNLHTWSDHQTEFLLSQIETNGQPPSYVYAELLSLRSDSDAKLILRSAGKLWSIVYTKKQDTTQFRFDTLLNGTLMRRGAKDVFTMNAGISLGSLILLPPNTAIAPGHHQLLVARLQLADAVRKQYPSTTISIDRIFRENDAEAALTSTTNVMSERNQWAIASAVASTLPGSLVASVIFFAILAGLFYLSKFAWTLPKRYLTVGKVSYIAFIAAISLMFVPGAAAATLVLAAAFSLATPSHSRSTPPDDLGPLFRFIMAAIGITWAFNGAFYFVLTSEPGRQLIQPSKIVPSIFTAGVYALLLAAILVATVLWAFAQRLTTIYVLKKAVIELCLAGAWTILIAVAFATPICAYENKVAYNNLQKMVANEPLYYLSK